MPEPNKDEELPPSSVPTDCQLKLRGLGDDPEWNEKFQRQLINVILACGRFMDLSRLEAVTVGFDYDDALDSVDLGYDSKIAKQYTKTDDLVGVAKVLKVKRDGAVRAHVVVDARFLGGLLSDSGDEALFAANIIAHELAHVATMEWLEECSPGLLLSAQKGDYAIAVMREAALTVWEEYAACRLSAPVSDPRAVLERYAECAQTAFDGVLGRARERIKEFRNHGDVSQLLVDLVGTIGNAFKLAAYLVGHADGIETEDAYGDLAPAIESSGLAPAFAELTTALHKAWDTRTQWEDLNGLDGIIAALTEAFRIAGANLTLTSVHPGSRIDVPYTSETMPNGDADMLQIAIQNLLGAN